MLVMMSIFPTAQHMLPRRQSVEARPFERILWLKETVIHLQHPLQIKRTHIQNVGDRNISVATAENLCRAVDGAHTTFDPLQLGCGNQIDFIEKNHVGEGHLLTGLAHLVKVLLNMPTINHGHNRVEQKLFLEIIIQKKSLRDWARIGHARGFNDDVIEFVPTLEQLAENTQQVASNSAANAAVIGFENFFLGTDDELVIDANFAELVFDDGNALAMVLSKNPIQQGGFAGAQKARQDGDGNPILGSHTRRMIT